MYGWRARFGLLVPSSNTTNEPEFRETLPKGVELYTARLPLDRVGAEELSKMSETASREAEKLSHANVDVLAYGCTTGSLVNGRGYALELEKTLSKSADAPAVVTALSVERALAALGANRISVVTPYIQELNELEREFLEAGSVEVENIDGRGLDQNLEIGALSQNEAYLHAAEAAEWDVDAVFISCTNYRTFSVIDQLEEDFGTPVVTSNQATLWDALRQMRIDSRGIGPGKLFEKARDL
ncbi:maleate cis-trans isomerase family protein [Natrononativus amylolyticus]|uniref:maleate cis-trans isomerase family protein n=1 Tax=Natrononativus amylolyticus TaxID=2963434 RepID=UPI0020CD7716|nr:maleate cis-trans isomerase [Natrononativus amylolyticus]